MRPTNNLICLGSGAGNVSSSYKKGCGLTSHTRATRCGMSAARSRSDSLFLAAFEELSISISPVSRTHRVYFFISQRYGRVEAILGRTSELLQDRAAWPVRILSGSILGGSKRGF